MASELAAAKRIRTSGPPVIATHSGHFHADEALAVYMLRLLPIYAHSPLVRTRDNMVLEECHTVVDVGGKCDPINNRFDHHQRDFNSTFPGHNTKLSSAGLVFMHLGKSIIAHQTALAEDSEDADRLWNKIYTDFIEAFDANDNGVSPYDVPKLQELGINKRFNDRGFSIASVVNRYNYVRDESDEGPDELKTKEQLQQEEDARFLKASEFAGTQFVYELLDTWRSWLPALRITKMAFDKRYERDGKGRVLIMPYRKEGLPWRDHLDSVEKEAGVPGSVLYVIFPETGEQDSKWRVRAVSKSKDGFENRKSLPESWRGLRDEQLDAVAKIEGCTFVHASGFIGGNKTRHGALAMARKACEMEEKDWKTKKEG